MSADRKPLLGWLWPERTPGPLDAQAVQTRMLRVPHRSLLRILLLSAASLVVVVIAASSILAAASASWLLVIPMAVVIATAIVLVLRAWTVGTYVNDDGIAVQRLLRTIGARWSDVASVIDDNGRVVVHTRNGTVFDTTLARSSIDILWRAEAYDMAKMQLQRWGEQR